MYLSARLARCASAEGSAGFHGKNIVVRELSVAGFVADAGQEMPLGELVRLRLPGAGAMLARVEDIGAGQLKARFLNPVGDSRLNRALGLAVSATR
jgi:hypothetical protein